MKKFFTLLIAAFLLVTAPVHAEISDIKNADSAADLVGESAEKFYVTLPKAKGDYKSRKRPILLEGAMNTETEIFVRALKNPVVYKDLNYLFVAGTYKNYPVVVARTEQGTANAAASTALAIKKFNPIAVINQGTAGGHDPALKIGDIVIATKCIPFLAIKTAYTPKGAGADFTRQEIRGTYAYDAASGKFQPYKEYFSDSTLFNIAFKVANTNENFNAVSGIIASSDAWLDTIDYVCFLNEKYGTSCAEMETVAAAQICQNADIPFIGIRVISDNAMLDDKYDPHSATIAQDFVLLVVENYIHNILRN